jgi:type I restriction enzyme M protein
MANVAAVISSIRNIMRQDRGISGDAQRLEQLGWMLFLKIIDDKDQELEVLRDSYVSVVPEKFQWRTWASDAEGITGDELLEFIDSNVLDNQGLFLTLRNLTSVDNPKRAAIVKEVFDGSNNFMKSGYEMRKVINKLNEIDFNNSDDKHIFGDIYESILQELRDAGNKGEYYTPRAVTQLMTQMTDPKLGDKVLDPSAGTGGFLTAAIDHVRDHYVNTVDDEHILQKSITGWELKPVAFVLGLTNLILHEMDIPDYQYIDSLKKEYNGISRKDQVEVILANPPFGASIADGVETNFPGTYRCKESADLFVILMLQLLKPQGRCAIVLPDGSISGDGVKARIREKLLTDCNLHTIIRLPQSTFFPATVSTNLLFFTKGSKTKDIWYYEHKLPEGQKSYSKTKPLQFSEFDPLIEWWGNREENSQAWKLHVEDLKDWNLDVKNPAIKRTDFTDSAVDLLKKINIKLATDSSSLKDLEKQKTECYKLLDYKIGDFLKRIKRPIPLLMDKSYKLVTIRMHQKGVKMRSQKFGRDIKSKMYEVKEGDFILSGIDARNGAFGIVSKELDGAIVTSDFWYFDIDESIIDKLFFLELTSTDWFDDLCKKGSDGTTQRIRLQKDKFFNQMIQLPKLNDQKKLVSKFVTLSDVGSNLKESILQIELTKQTILNEIFDGM